MAILECDQLPTTKRCSVCKEIKSASEFDTQIPKNPNYSISLKSWCKSCDVKKRRATRLFKDYGITETEYQTILNIQNGVCKICKQPCSTGQRLATDHIHGTKIVRGLLCKGCNLGIGCFKDNPALLKAAIEYLQEATNGTP